MHKRAAILRSLASIGVLWLLQSTACLAKDEAAAVILRVEDPGYFWHPEMAPTGPLVIVISLDEQSIYVYRNGVAIGAGPISSGRPGHETPTGVYTILQKDKVHHSNLYDNASMPFMQRLTWDGVAIHGGNLPGHPASHGCIRVPQSLAEKLFAISQPGNVVVVARASVMPATIVHPAVVAPIDLAGQPVRFLTGSETAPMAMASPGMPLNVVVSIHDRAAYVLQKGQLMASSPLDVASDYGFQGTVLYVMGAADASRLNENPMEPPVHVWSGYRILGSGPVPEPAQLASQLKLPEAFGKGLRQALIPGATVLVTDLPGVCGQTQLPYAGLLQSDQDDDHVR